MSSIHEAVLVEETMLALDVKPGGHYLDGTLGGATHSEELLKRSAPDGKVLSLDVDPKAIQRAHEKLKDYGQRWICVEGNFRELDRVAEENGFAPLDGILFDLGFSSDQLVDPAKGLTFQENGPLDMRFGPHANEDGLTAAEIVNGWSVAELEQLIRDYGEERFASRIAESIVKARKAARIVGTLDLVAVIRNAVPRNYERGRIHPATRTFQALRIVVNDELNVLKEGIAAAQRVLKPGGRLAVIAFHSLEDRIVKEAFRTEGWTRVMKKPIVATAEEVLTNPRSRTAKLRAAIKN